MGIRTAIHAAGFVVIALPSMAQEGPGEHFLLNWDLDEDGAVTVAEATERRGDVFFMFDADENEVLDAEEYVLFDETRAEDMKNNAAGHRGGGGRMQKGLTLTFNDVDGDGQVSKAEFLARTGDWITMVDRDDDGMITASDFGPGRSGLGRKGAQ